MQPQKYLTKKDEVGVIAAAVKAGQKQNGVELGPSYILDAGMLDQLKLMGLSVNYDNHIHDYTELLPASDPPIGKVLNPRYVGAVTSALSNQTYSHSVAGRMVLTLGGDHSIALGTISGVARGVKERLNKEIGVIWVDAHTDINTPETTDSGSIHGMPVAFLAGLVENQKVSGFEWVKPCLSPSKIVYIGLRSVDPGEREILRKHNIKSFSMTDVDRYGIGKVVEMALEHIGKDVPIHMSFDIDALDPTVAPSTGTPVPGGLSYREGHYIARTVHATGQMVAMDLVEVNVKLGDPVDFPKTVSCACSIIRSGLGETLT